MTFVGVKRLVFTFRPRGSPSVVVQPCLILCNPMDCSLLGSFFHGILQARILEWVAIPSPDLPNPRTEPGSPALQADSLLFEPQGRSVIENTAVLWVMNFIQDERREGRKLFQAGQCVNEYDH